MLGVQQQTWLGIAGALVPSLIGLMAAIVGLLNRKQLKTGEASNGKTVGQIATEVSGALETSNGKTVGTMVEEVHGEASKQATPYDTHPT